MCDDFDSGSDSGSSYDSSDSYGGGYSGGGGASADYSTPSVSVREYESEQDEAQSRVGQVLDNMDSFVTQAQEQLSRQYDTDDAENILNEAVSEGLEDFDINSIDFDGDFSDILQQFENISSEEILNVIMEVLELDVLDEHYFMQNKIRGKRVENGVIFQHKNFPCIIEVDVMTGEYTITAQLCETSHFLDGIEDSEQVDIKYVANLLELLKLNSRIAPCAISIIDDGDDDLTNDAVVMSLTQLITDGVKFDLQLAMNNFCSSLVIVKEALFAEDSEAAE